LMNTFDLTIYHAINGLAGHSHILDMIMKFFAKDALEIYALLFIIAWFSMPKSEIKHRHALVVAVFSGILALLINVVISHVWFRPRPFAILPNGSFTQLVPHSPDASFPSDHTSGSFGFAAASWGTNRKWISWSFTLLAVVVMFARVYVGVHWPTDVLAGFIIGTISGRLMWRFSRLFYPITLSGIKICGLSPKGKSDENKLPL
jgi:undecaprenyl-diphosphatase